MVSRSVAGAAFIALFVGSSVIAEAAELGAVKMPDGRIAAASTVIGLEVSPAVEATTTSSHEAGSYDDTSMTLSLSHRFESGFFANGSAEWQINAGGTQQVFIEGGGGYALRAGPFTLTPSAALGTTFEDTGFGPNGDGQAFYYAFYLAGDLDLDARWTWNAFKLRYRDAFDYEWVTPEVGTGLSYHLDAATSLYGKGSYSWKNTGDGLNGDSITFAFGLKRAL
jgi:hypothetical protein